MLAIDRIREVLEKLAPVEWSRLLPGEGMHDRLNYPPLIVWRFKETTTHDSDSSDIEDDICSTIKGFKGLVAWRIEKPGRNFVLTTEKFLELEQSGNFRSSAEVLKELAATHPQHGNEAHTDLAAIVDLLDRLAAEKRR